MGRGGHRMMNKKAVDNWRKGVRENASLALQKERKRQAWKLCKEEKWSWSPTPGKIVRTNLG